MKRCRRSCEGGLWTGTNGISILARWAASSPLTWTDRYSIALPSGPSPWPGPFPGSGSPSGHHDWQSPSERRRDVPSVPPFACRHIYDPCLPGSVSLWDNLSESSRPAPGFRGTDSGHRTRRRKPRTLHRLQKRNRSLPTPPACPSLTTRISRTSGDR